MSVFVDALKTLILDNVKLSDEVIIISGFFSKDLLEDIASLGVKTDFYFGMVYNTVITPKHKAHFDYLEKTYTNFKVFLPALHHVHTKCYIFKKAGLVTKVLVGSANCSSSALDTTPNSEMLVDVNDPADIASILSYATTINKNSVHYDDPIVVVSSGKASTVLKARSTRSKGAPSSWHNYSGNPFSAIIPLYTMSHGKPITHITDGLNWGNGSHHRSSSTSDLESCIPIRSFVVNAHPALIPFNGIVGSGSGGKRTRRQTPIDVTWDDGTVMKMLFQQDGTKIPPRPPKGTPQHIYPKALTANSGGVELGHYFRDRMKLPYNHFITYADLRTYGRDYVTLTLNSAGTYELDFQP